MEIKKIPCEAEMRDGFYVSERRKKVWNVEFELMQVVLDVCKRHNLKIWAFGGTLLGAVRHHGFIPWDDDVDLAMPREDYDKLIEIGPEEFKYPYFFQSAYNEDSYWLPFVKIRHCGTTAILKSEIYEDINQGIFIDIFPLDGVDDDKEALERKAAWRDNLIFEYREYDSFRPPVNRLFFKYIRGYLASRRKFRKKSKLDYYKEMEEKFRSVRYSESDHYGDVQFIVESFPNIDDGIEEYEMFEGIRLPVKKDWDTCLRLKYGDYMTPVMGGAMHGGVIFDTEKPYTYYLPILRKEHTRFKEFVRELKTRMGAKEPPYWEDDLKKL